MKKITRYYKRLKITYAKAALLAGVCAAFFLPSYTKFEKTGDNFFTVKINGAEVGVMGDTEHLDEYIREARKKIASESDELILMDINVETEGREVHIVWLLFWNMGWLYLKTNSK